MTTTTSPHRGSATGTRQQSLPGLGSLSSLKEAEATGPDTGDEEPKLSRKERKAAEKAARTLSGNFEDHPHLMAIKPMERYFFRSDYFEVDNSVACVLGFFHDDGSRDDFAPFWGVSRIPADLGEGVTTVVLEQVRRMGEKWVDDRIKTSERLDKLDEQEQAEGGTLSSRRRSAKIADDVETASAEIQDGASYLHVHNRLMVKAPDVDALDAAVEKIGRIYIDRFGTLKVAPYPGEQRRELSSLFAKNEKKRGKGFHFTSTEYAGSYHLVTNGLNDPSGEYVGYMIGDVNNSAVLFDVDAWDHHVVVADSTQEQLLDRAYYSDMWGSKIGQSALLNNRRVVHIVLDGANLDRLGPRLNSMTARLDMSKGDINMFEMFGEQADELSIFPAHLDKIVLMVEQAFNTTENDRSIIRGSLKQTLTQFYIDKEMWVRNAKTERHRLRLVGIPHNHVPRLQDIVTYFDTEYLTLANRKARDDQMLKAYNVLRLVFRDLLDNQGDLFNTWTNDEIDAVGEAHRVVYDFSRLMWRGHGVAMAQLVNVIGFAVDNLELGDVVLVHGTENIDSMVKPYITRQLARHYEKGGRVAYLYNDVDKMLADVEFSKFDAADWTVLGPMRDVTVSAYQQKLHQDIPPDLERLITSRGEKLSYLRRGHTNVVFHTDLALGINPAREPQRRKAEMAAGTLGLPGDAIRAARQAEEEAREAARAASTQEAVEADRVAAEEVRRMPKHRTLRVGGSTRPTPSGKTGTMPRTLRGR